MKRSHILFGLAVLILGGGVLRADADDPMVVQLCDGKTTTTVDKNAPKTKENGQKIAADLMAQWQRAHPEANWIATEREKHSIVDPADNKDVIGRTQGQSYGQV